MISVDQQHGNAEVVAALEQYLAAARQGRMVYVAIAAIAAGKASCWFGGASHLAEPMRRAIVDRVVPQMDAAILNRTLPPRDPALGADHVCYNVAAAPLSFDFLAWLVDAEMTRVREGAPAPLKVAFWFGRDGRTGLDLPSRRRMLDNVVRPMLALIGAVEDERAVGGRFKDFFTMRDVAAAARSGEPPPRLRAPADVQANMARWLRGRAPVTITLREAEHWPHRNSDIGTWIDIARYLRARGEWVVFVRDTAKAGEPLPGGEFETCSIASTDLHARVALYAAAKANLFISNGPGSLAWFGDRPFLFFLELQPDGHPYEPDTPKFFRESMGLEVGEQFAWFRPDQRIVWGKPTYETIVAALDSVRCGAVRAG